MLEHQISYWGALDHIHWRSALSSYLWYVLLLYPMDPYPFGDVTTAVPPYVHEVGFSNVGV